MEWFTGSVDGALTEYQNKNGILIVYVYADNDENSTKLGNLLEALDTSVFENIAYVAIRMLKGSEGANQFAQFFPTLTVPVCYILGMNAQPLEVITGLSTDLTSEKLISEFKKAVKLFKEQLGEKSKIDCPIKNEETKNEESSTNEAIDQQMDVKNEEQNNPTADEINSQEKLEHYKKLLEEKKKADAKKEEEERHRKEMERRNDGKSMAEVREKQRERELREAAEERRRQKAEDASALQRLRDQIRVDKEERAAAAAAKSEGGDKNVKKTEKVEVVEMNKPVNSDDCQILCRFHDGSTLKLVFPSKEPLKVVYDAVNEDARKPSSDFLLMQSYPRKKLTDMDKSLLDLGLTPSAVLIVVSEKNANERNYGNGSLLPTYYSYFEMLLGFLFTPFAAIWRFFYSLFNTRGTIGSNISTGNKKNKTSKKKNDNEETTVKDGNIRRFKEDSSDHSDNEATWNGNSTQQL